MTPSEPTWQDDVYIGLGANLGDRATTLRQALDDLAASPDVVVEGCSRFHETEPQGGPPGQPRYLNAVARLRTRLGPRALLDLLLEVERRHGRTREVPNGPRTLDLDLLIYGRHTINQPGLIVPHPRMWQRSFVLEPLAELTDPAVWRARLCGECDVH